MSIRGILLQPVTEECPYIDGMLSIHENLLIVDLDDIDLEALLSLGFRHFGEVFFKPLCSHCRSCISIRIPVRQFVPSKWVRRLFKRNKHFQIKLEKPVPTQEGFQLYKKHKKRFKSKTQFYESYVHYVRSFFHPFEFNQMLTIRDGARLVAVSHLDVTDNAMSAVYCYFDEDYARFSPGRLAIYKEIELAKEMGIQWLYLGYYVAQNRHTHYKIIFKPSQWMVEPNQWFDYLDASGNIVKPLPPNNT